MTEPPSFMTKLDGLVEKIMEAAMVDGVKLSERLDALKICSQHYVNTERLKGKKPLDDTGGDTMDGLRNRIANGAATPKTEIDDEQT